jgi:hypothetical protein
MKENFKETIKQRTDKDLEKISTDGVFYSEEERLIALNELELRSGLSKEMAETKQSIELSMEIEEENEEVYKEATKYKSGNPALRVDTFTKAAQKNENAGRHMTVKGTVMKSGT